MARRYELCGYVVAMYPTWKHCARPVRSKPGAFTRCPEHQAKLPYWPGREDPPS